MNFIKRLSYNAFIIKIIRFLHLRYIVRKVYYRLIGPKNGILDVKINGINTKYYVRNPNELRLAESVSGDWGEKPVIESLTSYLNPNDCVYDIGANIGIYSAILAKAVGQNGKIVVFEPEQESIKHLQENIKLNNLSNVIIFQKALGENNEKGKLYIGKTTGNFSLIKLYEERIGHQDVEVVNGDDFVSKNNLPIPKAVKIDVEGYEYAVLKGLKNTLSNINCKIICCEIHPGFFSDGITEEIILNFIKSLGFLNVSFFRKAFFKPYHIIAKKSESYKK